jgi:hypothetical protein
MFSHGSLKKLLEFGLFGAGALWRYDTHDPLSVVTSAKYFHRAAYSGLAVGDFVFVRHRDSGITTVHSVVSIRQGDATISPAPEGANAQVPETEPQEAA